MLWRLAVVVLVAGAGSVCRYAVDADGEVVAGNYGVKLCGREFIRAVIYTCGGSRWRRSLDPFQVSSYIDADEGDFNQRTWQQQRRGFEADARRSPSQVSLSSRSLADLLPLLGATGGEPAEPEGGSQEQQQQQQPQRRQWFQKSSPPRLAERERNPPSSSSSSSSSSSADGDSSAATANKRKRDFNVGVAGMCCSQGCTKNDIGYLC